jgi:hypothetical protein
MIKKILSVCFIAIFLLSSCNRTAEKKESQLDSIDTTTQDSLPVPQDSMIDIPEEAPQSESLALAITKIIQAFHTQNSRELNNYIDKTVGFYTIYRPGVQAIYTHASAIDFNHPIPEYYPYPQTNFSGKVIFGQLPIYDCGKETWNKKGLFCNNKQHPTELSHTAKFMNEISDAKISNTEIRKLKALEAKSYRVILTDKNAPLIFHLTNQNGKWIFTVLDRAYAGCDA